VSDVWLTVLVVSAATIALKAIGPVVLAGRELPRVTRGLVEMLAPALLAALVVTQAIGGDRRYVFDARLAGLAAAVVAIRLRAPTLLVVVLAAAVTAAARAIA
jgi:branched-subunit amino acid transport protein